MRGREVPSPFRLVLVGWGAISQRLAALLWERAQITPIAVALRSHTATVVRLPGDIRLISDPKELLPLRPDLVVEAASVSAVAPWGRAAMAAGAGFAPVSIAALLDDALHSALRAGDRGWLLYPSGAIGGLDILRSARNAGLVRVEHRVLKPAHAWKGTAAEACVDLDALKVATEFAHGSVREIAAQYPQNANSTATTAFAGLGLDGTHVRLVADPGLDKNVHVIEIEAKCGNYTLRFENNPIPDNPKTSEMAALSLLTLIEAEAASMRRRPSRTDL